MVVFLGKRLRLALTPALSHGRGSKRGSRGAFFTQHFTLLIPNPVAKTIFLSRSLRLPSDNRNFLFPLLVGYRVYISPSELC
jgi:hypothetical protein